MDEDQEICRVCRCESTPDHPLYHPCKCSGSIRFVHEDCLIEWLSHSRKKYCELCEHPFTFSPIYRDDMPETVPFYVLFKQLLNRFISVLKTSLRGVIVAITWLIVLPNFTLWTWRFFFWSGENIGFYPNLTENSNDNSSIDHTNTDDSFIVSQLKNFLTDCLEGLVITAFVIIIFVAAYLFREWVMQNLPADQVNDENPVRNDINVNPNNNNGDNVDRLMQEQEAIDTLLNAMQVLNPPEDENNNNRQQQHHDHHPENHINHQLNQLRAELRDEIHASLDENEDMPYDEWYNSVSDRLFRNEDRELFGGVGSSSSSSQQPIREEEEEDTNEQPSSPPPSYEPRREVPVWESGRWEHNNWNFSEEEEEDDDDDEDEDNAQPVPDYLRERDILNERERLRMREQIEQVAAQIVAEEADEPLDIGDDINGVLEAIGMRGNPWILVQNSVLMSLMISLCLGVAVWIPYVVGRLVIMIRPITFIETPIYLMRLITDPLVDFVLDLCVPYIWSKLGDSLLSLVPQQIQIALQQAQEHVTLAFETVAKNETSPSSVKAGSDSVMMNMDWTMIQNKFEVMSSVALARWHQFAMGRTGLDRSMCIFVGYLVLIGLGSWYLTHGKRQASPRRGAQTTSETIRDVILQQGIFLKVLFFILIELVIFPTVCGVLLDMSTLPLFVNASFESRYAFHIKSPYTSYFIHWFLGTGVLFYFATFITVCREIIRPGVMWFIRDPNDPQFHPVQEMVERPLPNLLHKISQSALVYSVMLVFGVGTVTYSLAYTGVVFPLCLPFNVPLSTWGIDLLTIQFLLPPLIQLLNPRDYSKKALDLWWHYACRQLRLTSFMFNKREPDEEGRHVRKTFKAFLLQEQAKVLDSEVELVDDSSVEFRRDGMMVRVPKYDSVPVDPKRRMIVPVDPITLEAIDEEEQRRGHPAAADTVDESQSTIVVYIPPFFNQRIMIFLVYMWFAISVFACSVTVVPLLFGRFMFNHYLAPESTVNDLYSFALGSYMMTGIGIFMYWIRESYLQLKNGEFKQFAIEKAAKVSKFLYLAFNFGILIPLLFGVAVDLFVFMPFRVTRETEFAIPVSQNWCYGVAYMSILQDIIHVLPTNNPVRQKLTGIFGDNIMQADLIQITRAFIVPVIISALLAICIPAILSRVILQLLDSNDPITVIRYTYPAIFGILLTMLLCFSLKKLFYLWMETVRDDTYLIGKRLHNMQTNPASSIE